VEVFGAGDRRKLLTQNVDRSQTLKLKGGWFDAGDYDTRSVHLDTVATLVDLYNTNPGYFQRFNPNIPESGDGIPDILNEAMWGLQLYKQLQQPDGGVSAGYEFDSHPAGTRSWEEQEAFVWAPDFRSSYRFATAAAKMSTAIAAYDPQEANDLKQRAVQAFDWAEQDFAAQSRPFKGSGKANEFRQYRQLAAAEVYRLTGQDKYHDVFRSIKETRNYDASFTYAQLDPKVYSAVDVKWQAQLRNGLIQNADNLVRFGKKSGFDTVNNPAFDQNWGFNTVITNKHGHYLAMAHQLTGDDKYLDTLAQSMPFGMGMNPDNLSFTTGTQERGLAYDEVEAILHDDGRAMDQVPDGITAYGFYSRNWFAWPAINKATNNTFFNKKSWSLDVPLIEAFNDYHLLVPSTEYTIHGTIDDQIFANGYLASQAASQPSPVRRSSDALTGMSMSMQVAGDPNVNDALTNYAASSDAALGVAAEPSAGSHFLTLESATATTQDVDAIALSAIGNSSPNESEDSPLGDGLSAVTGTSPLEVDPNPIAAVV
jgi:endoglucanase